MLGYYYSDDNSWHLVALAVVVILCLLWYLSIINATINCDPHNLRTINGTDICIEESNDGTE